MEAAGAVHWPNLSQVAAMGMVPVEGWLAAPPMGMPSMEGSPSMPPTGMPPMGTVHLLGPRAPWAVAPPRAAMMPPMPNAPEAQDPYHRLGKGSEEEAGPEEEDAFFNSGGLCFNADNKFFSVGKHHSSQLWHQGRHPCCQQCV